MPVRDLAPSPASPAVHHFMALSADPISVRRRIRMQAMTDLYATLDNHPIPGHIPLHCTTVYELEDRTKPSVSSF